MIDVDRWLFRFDIASVPISGGVSYFVLRRTDFTQPTSLEAGVYGIAVLICAAVSVASLLLVRQQLTEWEIYEPEIHMLRSLLGVGWVFPQSLVGLPDMEPFGQLLLGIPLIVCGFLVIVLLLLFICVPLITSVTEDAHVT
jgi:hypothetical protein